MQIYRDDFIFRKDYVFQLLQYMVARLTLLHHQLQDFRFQVKFPRSRKCRSSLILWESFKQDRWQKNSPELLFYEGIYNGTGC